MQKSSRKIMSWLLTLSAVGAAVIHALIPSIVIDETTALLLAVAAIPWFGSLFRSIELPGGVKVEYHDLKEAENKARESGLLTEKSSPPSDPFYVTISSEDPNLALAGLRIEIERELISLAKRHNISTERRSIMNLARDLTDAHVFGSGAYLALADTVHLLNNAVHGAKVEQSAVNWALTTGQDILASIRSK
jgi:hypothetical protein